MSAETPRDIALASLFDAPVCTAQAALDDPTLSELHPEERESLARARPERVQEFRAGRHAARVALAALGAPRGPLRRRDDRTPAWPDGVVGSIAHVRRGDSGWAGVVVAWQRDVTGLGLDVELDEPLEPALWERVLRPAERRALDALPEPERGAHAMQCFSAKESVYKAQFGLTGRFLEFDDVELAWEGARFSAAVLGTMGRPSRVGGRLLRVAGLVVTTAALS